MFRDVGKPLLFIPYKFHNFIVTTECILVNYQADFFKQIKTATFINDELVAVLHYAPAGSQTLPEHIINRLENRHYTHHKHCQSSHDADSDQQHD